MKPLLQREWLLTRWPLAGALVAQLTFLLVQAPRTYATVRESDPSIIGLLLAAWLGYHRVYAEQKRGTWLLQPFSRTQLVLAKVFHASAALLLFALVESLSRYVWVCTSASPGGPILSLLPYLQEALSVVLGTCLALLFATVTASFLERPWQQVASIAAGLAWVLVATLHTYQIARLLGSSSEFLIRIWPGAVLLVVFVLGLIVVVRACREAGRERSRMTHVFTALWVMPLALAALLFAEDLFGRDPQRAPEFNDVVLLRDGEIVVAHFDSSGGHAVRRDGRSVRLPLRWSDEESERASLFSSVREAPPFGTSVSFSHGNAYVSEDGRSLSIYGVFDEADRRVACWGAEGMREGDVACAPGPEIIAARQFRPGGDATDEMSLLIVTSEAVHVLDADGAHVRLRASGIEGVTLLQDEGDREVALATFTPEALLITGGVERRCPHAPRGALVGLLSDSTVVVLDHDVLTYCRNGGVTTVPWPTDVESERTYFDAEMSLLLPLRFNAFASLATWWAAALFRVLGIGLLVAMDRKRGLVIGLPGLLLGPAYSLAVAIGLLDVSRLIAWLRGWRTRHAASRNTSPAKASE